MCKSFVKMGLGLRSIRDSQSFVGLGADSLGLWQKLIGDKYNLNATSWLVPSATYRAPGMLKSILSSKDDFDKCIRHRAHNGQKIELWDELWCGDSALE